MRCLHLKLGLHAHNVCNSPLHSWTHAVPQAHTGWMPVVLDFKTAKLCIIISQSLFSPKAWYALWRQWRWRNPSLRRNGRLMYVFCTMPWRLLAHTRNSLSPLSSSKGFTERLKVLHVCTRSGSVRSAWAADLGSRFVVGIGRSGRLALLQRSLVPTCLFVHGRNRKTYWWYVVRSANETLLKCVRKILFIFLD